MVICLHIRPVQAGYIFSMGFVLMSNQKTIVAARDENLPNSPVSNEEDDTVTVDEGAKCLWNGQEFADGDAICADGEYFVCSYGSWMKLPAEALS